MKWTIQTVGLVLSALLAVLDIAGILGAGMEQAPPLPLILLGAALGVITLVAVVLAWRGGRGGLVTVVITRGTSVLLNVPAYFASLDWPGPAHSARDSSVASAMTWRWVAWPS